MFTFGREHEKKCAAQYLRDPNQIEIIEGVVDAVHDLLDGHCDIDDAGKILAAAFSRGGSGAWEQTASWMSKLACDYPKILSEWRSLASHSKANVRFRVACCLNDMPPAIANEVGGILANDKSKKVREMAEARLEEISGE